MPGMADSKRQQRHPVRRVLAPAGEAFLRLRSKPARFVGCDLRFGWIPHVFLPQRRIALPPRRFAPVVGTLMGIAGCAEPA